MRKTFQFTLFIAAFLAVFTTSLAAQGTEQELAAFTQKWQDAYNAADHATLATMYTREVISNNEDGSTSTLTNEQIGAKFESDFHEVSSKIEIKLTRMMTQADGKVKISGSFNSKNILNEAGEMVENNGTFEHVVVKEGRDWKLCELKVIPN